MYGPKNSLLVDDDYQVLLKMPAKTYRSYLAYFVGPTAVAGRYLRNAGTNVKQFARRKFHFPYDSGMKVLLTAFYDSIENGTPAPLSHREILLTTKIMDRIFEQVGAAVVSR